MAVIKFHEKNIALFAKIESTVGTYNAPAALDAIAATSLTGSVTYETGANTYVGDDLSRDEYTYQKDSYADVQLETLQQVVGTLNGSLAVVDAPLSESLQACGANITVLASTNDGRPAGTVIYDNATANNNSLSIDYRKTSPDDTLDSTGKPINQKLIKFTACRGSVDIAASVGIVPTLKFNFKGNAANPIQAPTISPNFGAQVSLVASTVRMSSIVSAKIAPAMAITSISRTTTTATVVGVFTGLTTGDTVTISGVTGLAADVLLYNGTFVIASATGTGFTYTMTGTPTAASALGSPMLSHDTKEKAFAFSSLTASNFFGFDFTRYVTSVEEGFAKGAVPTDVSLTMLEDKAPTIAITSLTSTTTTATAVAPGHGLIVGNSVTISGATGAGAANYNITALVATVTTTTVANDTFTYAITTYTGSATGTPIVVNNSATNFDPDSNISNFFAVKLKFGTGAGKYVTYRWNKLQLSNAKEGKVGSYFGRDVTFRNTGKSYLILE